MFQSSLSGQYVEDASPIKQHPYCINPLKMEVMKKEVEHVLANGIIEPSRSQWSSPGSKGGWKL